METYGSRLPTTINTTTTRDGTKPARTEIEALDHHEAPPYGQRFDARRQPRRSAYPDKVSSLGAVMLPLHATPEDQPPPLTPIRLLTEWSSDWWIALGIAVPAVLYAAGVIVLRRRGDRWPVRRSVAFFVGGLGSALIATMSALGAYDTVLFSVHVVQHIVLMMITPMFLALGAPVTLALRTLPRRPRSGPARAAALATGSRVDLRPAGAGPVHRHAVRSLLLHALRDHPPVDVLARVPASAFHRHRRDDDVAAGRRRPDSRAARLSVPAAGDVPDAAVPRLPRHLDHEREPADRRGLVPGFRSGPGRRARWRTSTWAERSCGPPAT